CRSGSNSNAASIRGCKRAINHTSRRAPAYSLTSGQGSIINDTRGSVKLDPACPPPPESSSTIIMTTGPPVLTLLTRLFPLWALLAASLAWAAPASLNRFDGVITPLLMLIMFSMGLTLNWQDFARVWQRPGRVALGVLLQFSIMPLAALAVARLLQL